MIPECREVIMLRYCDPHLNRVHRRVVLVEAFREFSATHVLTCIPSTALAISSANTSAFCGTGIDNSAELTRSSRNATTPSESFGSDVAFRATVVSERCWSPVGRPL